MGEPSRARSPGGSGRRHPVRYLEENVFAKTHAMGRTSTMKLHGLTIGSILLCLGVAGVGAAGCTATASGAAGTTSGSGSGGSGSGGTGTPQPTVSDFPNCTADSSLACDPSAIGI